MSEPTMRQALLKQSRDLMRKQKYSDAAELLQGMLDEDLENEDAWELLGLSRFLGNELDLAREAFEQLTKLNSGRAQGWVNLGAVLNRQGEFKRAAETLRRALQKDRKCAEGYYNLGIAQRGLNLNTMAISAYKEAIKFKPDFIEAHLNLGNIYVDLKNLGQALLCFQNAVRLNPSSKKAQFCLEKAKLLQSDSRKSVSPFGRLVDVEKLDQQIAVGPRILDEKTRIAERETVREVTRVIRVAAKEVVPLLEESLHARLHQLERIVLQNDSHLSSADPAEAFSQDISELQRIWAVLKGGLAQTRQLVAKGS